MNTKRRNFIKSVFWGAGLLSSGIIIPACTSEEKNTERQKSNGEHTQRFNMSGYAAPKIDFVRVGIIGLGNRSSIHINSLMHLDGVKIVAICDVYEDRIEKCRKEYSGLAQVKTFSGSEEAYKKLCEDPDIDLVFVITPWAWHTPMAVYAMEQGKHVAMEVPAAKTLDECWQLVETSERTKKHCMMLENCCYDFFELLTLNMARQGYFGEVVHCEGAYLHDLKDHILDKGYYADMWRLKENITRNGNLYPTHGLGPVCQIMNINRGDKMEYLTATQSADFQFENLIREKAAEDPFYNEFVGKGYRGNMNTTVIKTHKGRTIMIQHDVSDTQPYSRIHKIQGTNGTARKWPEPAKIAQSHEWLTEEEMKELNDKYAPEIINKVGEMAKEVGGHGGMDFIMAWRLIDCLRNGLPLDQDVYDAALWSAVTPLSEWSVANRSNSIDVPDFTCGSWETNVPVNLTLEGGGTTDIRN